MRELDLQSGLRNPEWNAPFLCLVAGLYDRIILECNLIKRLRIWVEFIWLRIGSKDGFTSDPSGYMGSKKFPYSLRDNKLLTNFDVLLTVHLSIFILVINQLDAQNCFTISLFHASTCFEHHVLIVRRSKLYYTASGIITPVGVMIPDAV